MWCDQVGFVYCSGDSFPNIEIDSTVTNRSVLWTFLVLASRSLQKETVERNNVLQEDLCNR